MSQGLDFALLPLTFVFTFLPTIGIIGNAIMIMATFKAKRMNSPCHILIAVTCFMDLLHEIGQYPFVYHYFRMTTMAQSDCFWMQIIPIIGVCAGCPLLLSLGLDRFIAVRFPSKYRALQEIPFQYVSCHFLFPIAYTVYLLVDGVLKRSQDLVQCSIPQAFGPSAFGQLNQIGFGINIAIVLVYMLSFFILRRSAASTKMRTVFKSIFVTVAIVVFGWMFTFLVNSLSIYITDSPYIRGLINMYAGITVNIGTMSNIFVFYAINTEYRDVIRQMLCKQRKIEKGHEVSTMHGLADSRRTKFSGLTVVHG